MSKNVNAKSYKQINLHKKFKKYHLKVEKY